MIVLCSSIDSLYCSSLVYDVLQRQRTALHLACERGHSEVVNILLEKGCDPTLKDGVSHYSSESL